MPNQFPTLDCGGIDWEAVHRRLERSREALDEAFSGRGAWTDELLRQREEELAEQAGASPDAGRHVPYLIVRGEGGRYALELRRLGLIQPLTRVVRVPGAPPELLGLIAVNGRAMRLFDLDRLCGNAAAASRAGGFAILLRAMNRPTALRVQALETALDLDITRFGPRSEAGPFIQAFTEDHVAILDMAAIIDSLMKGIGKE